jgi:probable F420-dependent oxidoreductase
MAKRQYWGTMFPMPAADIGSLAKMQEDMGLAGTFSAQVYGPPWIPLAAAAVTTSRMKLASGIALAFVRSPFETAMAAMDLDRLSGGRFILGLGPSVKTWSEGFFGMPYGKPVEHLRDTIAAVRHVMANSHTGAMANFKSKYYELDFTEFQPLAQPVRPAIPVWVAATRGSLVRLAGETCEGLMGHPIWTVDWARKRVAEDLKIGLDKAGRKREDVHVNLWFWVAPNEDGKQSIEDARSTCSFYGGIAQYEPYFAAQGFARDVKALQKGVQTGSFMDVAHQVSDEMAQTFVVTGTPDEVRRKLEPAWEIADSLTLVSPLFVPPERLIQYTTTVAQVFY